jgi:hypothetical protein
MEREPLKPGTVAVLVCSKCERDIVVVRVLEVFVERLSKWFGCDCEPARARLDVAACDEVVRRRIDTKLGVHVERWKEHV